MDILLDLPTYSSWFLIRTAFSNKVFKYYSYPCCWIWFIVVFVFVVWQNPFCIETNVDSLISEMRISKVLGESEDVDVAISQNRQLKFEWKRQKMAEHLKPRHDIFESGIRSGWSRIINFSFNIISKLEVRLSPYFLKWAKHGFFVYFRPFLVTISIILIEKSINGVLGIQTEGHRIVGADETT